MNFLKVKDNNRFYIDNYAFIGCKNLESVILPDDIMTIGKESFSNCGKLSITVPSGVKAINDSDAFINVKHVYYSGTAKALHGEQKLIIKLLHKIKGLLV